MARICPQCNQANQDDTTFCRFCGYRFPENGQAANEDATIRPSSLAGVPSNADPSSTIKTGEQQAPVAQSTPSAMQTPQPQFSGSNPGYPPPVATPNSGPFQGQGGFAPQQQGQQGGYPPQTQQPYGQAPYGAPVLVQAPAAPNAMERAFAGRGTPVHHQSWLLDGKQVQPATLRNSLIENIQRQGVMGITAIPERLREKGVALEERDYVRVQYGNSAIFVYMAPMGQNLYVSRTSTVHQPLSPTRVGVVIGLVVLMLISLLFYAVIHPSYGDILAGNAGFAEGANTFFGYAFYGLLFFLLFLLIRSLVFLLTDKDFLAYLRPNRLNDFTLDTLSCAEKVTDKSIRETLRQAGLNTEEITSPAQSYAPQQALHHL